MNIIILHGDDTEKSLARLDKFIATAKSRDWEIVNFEKNQGFSISEALSSVSLFSKDRLFVVNDAALLTSADLKWLKAKSENFSGTLVIRITKAAPVTLLKSLPKDSKIEKFKLPKIIFTFLDSFYPGNNRECLKLLHTLINREPVEMVFSLLARQVRDIYWVQNDVKSLPYPGWRMVKLKKQAAAFAPGILKEIIELLAKADIAAKVSEASLIDSLDQIIIQKLE